MTETNESETPTATNPIAPVELPSSPAPSRRTGSVTSSSSSRKGHRSTSEHVRKKDKHSCERTCHRDLAKLLVYEERETRDLTHLLRQLHEQLAKERDRADEAERRLVEVFDSIKVINEARMVAAAQAAHAREELAMYKVRWSEAHQEVVRAQKMLEDLDRRRQEAEEEAAKMRSLVREMREDRLISNAREEGRQLGLNEGLRTRGFVHSSSRRRYRTPSSSEGDDETESEQGIPSEAESRKTGRSRAPSISQMSRMSVPLRTPYLSTTRPPSSEASQSRPISPSDVPAPTPVRNSPASHHAPFAIPPDGWIPETGRDSYIHLPPPHELSKPILSPEVSPQRPEPTLPAEPPPAPAPAPAPVTATPRRRRGHGSSPESNSTTLSDFELVQPSLRTRPSTAHLDPNGINGMKSPLSVINEVLSVNSASPNPVPASAPPPIVVSSQAEEYYRRPVSSASSSTDSSPQFKAKTKSRRSSTHTVPDINILPPSRPVSDGSGKPTNPGLERQPSSGSLLLSPAAAMSPAPVQVPPPVPGAYSDNGYLYSPVTRTPMTPGEPPVIPDIALRKQAGVDGSFESGSTTPSSGMSAETLTTPPHYHRNLNVSSPVYTEARVPLPTSTMGGMTPKAFSQVGTVYSEAKMPLPPSTVGAMTPKASSQFGGSVYSEARMPLPPSVLGTMTPKTSSVFGGFTRSKKGSISSTRK